MTIFGDKLALGKIKSYSATDLLDYVESLMKSCKTPEKIHNYSWLKSKEINNYYEFTCNLTQLKPIVQKLSPANRAAIAVKLDSCLLTSPEELLNVFKKFLEEEQKMVLINDVVKKKKLKTNKVQPELLDRSATVCFVLSEEYF